MLRIAGYHRWLERALVALVLCLAAPAHAGPRVTRFAPPSQPAPTGKKLPVFDLGTAPPRPVRVLAVISLESAGPTSLSSGPDHEFWARLFQAPARAAGAQAVVGLHAVHKFDSGIYAASALAVEDLDPGSAPDSCGCVLAVPEPHVKLGVSEDDRAEIASNLRDRLVVLAAGRGWYPLAGDTAAAATLGHGVDAWLSLALDSLRMRTDEHPERSRRITSDPSGGWWEGVACNAALVGAAGDTLFAATRPVSTTDVFAMLHRDPPAPRALPGGDGSRNGFWMMDMSRHGPRGPIDADYWRAVRKELESLPGPARAR
ncbi:MAG TPA: hypothetical protein VI504_04780 [Candidatus Eisenbacteria bacterium]|jgi:hypothetical protein